MRRFAIFIVRQYQRVLSPMAAVMGAQCRFYPTCSQYAIAAFSKKSFWRAVYMTARRLAKCGPWNEGGVDKI